MPERDTMRVTLGDGQINLNGTMFDVDNIAFTQDTVDVTGHNGEVLTHLNTDGTFTATINNAVYNALQEALANVGDVAIETADPVEELNELIDRFQTRQREQDLYYATTTGYRPNYITVDEAFEPSQTLWSRYNPSYFRWDDIPSVKDAIVEEDLSKKNRKLDKFLNEFAPKEVVV